MSERWRETYDQWKTASPYDDVSWCECDPPPIPDEEHENKCPACGFVIAQGDSPQEGNDASHG